MQWSRIEWSTISKAAEKSEGARMVASAAISMSETTLIKTVFRIKW